MVGLCGLKCPQIKPVNENLLSYTATNFSWVFSGFKRIIYCNWFSAERYVRKFKMHKLTVRNNRAANIRERGLMKQIKLNTLNLVYENKCKNCLDIYKPLQISTLRKVTWRTLHSGDPQIWSVTAQNVVATSTCRPGFLHPWYTWLWRRSLEFENNAKTLTHWEKKLVSSLKCISSLCYWLYKQGI